MIRMLFLAGLFISTYALTTFVVEAVTMVLRISPLDIKLLLANMLSSLDSVRFVAYCVLFIIWRKLLRSLRIPTSEETPPSYQLTLFDNFFLKAIELRLGLPLVLCIYEILVWLPRV